MVSIQMYWYNKISEKLFRLMFYIFCNTNNKIIHILLIYDINDILNVSILLNILNSYLFILIIMNLSFNTLQYYNKFY